MSRKIQHVSYTVHGPHYSDYASSSDFDRVETCIDGGTKSFRVNLEVKLKRKLGESVKGFRDRVMDHVKYLEDIEGR